MPWTLQFLVKPLEALRVSWKIVIVGSPIDYNNHHYHATICYNVLYGVNLQTCVLVHILCLYPMIEIVQC